MADEVIVQQVDDLLAMEGQRAPADHRIVFSLSGYGDFDGIPHQIDLTEANARKLAQVLAPYLKASVAVKTSKTSPGRRDKVTKIRRWANDNGIVINASGPIPAEVERRYDEATGDESVSQLTEQG